MRKIRILIIHTAFIGDIVLSTPLIKKLRDTYPKAEITYLTTPIGASILRNNPYLTHIIEYDKRGEHRGIKGFWAITKKIKMELSYNSSQIFKKFFYEFSNRSSCKKRL